MKWLTPKPKKLPEKILTLKEMVELGILLIPYLRALKDTKKMLRESNNADGFYILIDYVLKKLPKEEISRISRILFDRNADEITVPEMVRRLPGIIEQNDLLDGFIILKQMGLFD
jgi:hypothetical protein